ncbi:MAG: hypothetical protein G01um101413_140 [Parcubacteria group bacterium Gr01-1014_13]|nr:MAG: hypothetical protein G01um101413_140 [Parcubacteria group bacterium Gr01-1014_13]
MKVSKIFLLPFSFLIALAIAFGVAFCTTRWSWRQEDLQKKLVAGENSVYLFDESSGMLAHAWKGAGGYGPSLSWVFPSRASKGKTMAVERMESQRMAPVYLFDPGMGICVIGYRHRDGMQFWPVPCADVKDKLDPSVREQVEAQLKKFPSECP